MSKVNVPSKQIMERRIGELLKHFKEYNIQTAKKRIQEEAWRKERQKLREEQIEKLIKLGKKYGISKENIQVDLREEYALEEMDAEEMIALYW